MENEGKGDRVPLVMIMERTLRYVSSLMARAGAKHQYEIVLPPANPPPPAIFVTWTRYDLARARARRCVPLPKARLRQLTASNDERMYAKKSF
jgi:hypothetical protein